MGITCNNNSTKHKKNVIKVNNISEKSINLIKLIRSKYIITDIFSYLPEEKKLKIISYNKKLQNYLDIDIKNYKIISDRYRVGNRNGKGKEYAVFFWIKQTLLTLKCSMPSLSRKIKNLEPPISALFKRIR